MLLRHLVENIMIQFLHELKHPFIARQLIWEMADGGGMNFGLGCMECGSIEWIDYYRGMALKRGREAVHVNDFLKYFQEDHH